jgi:hypothetical protein
MASLAGAVGHGVTPLHAQDGQVTDSADVRIVFLARTPSAASEETPVSEVFSTLRSVDLYRITSAVYLSDVTLAVANAGTREIVFLGPGGRVVRRYGREGKGPGEFSWIRAVGLTKTGNLWAYDDRLGRLTEIPEPEGKPRTRPLRPADRITSLEPLSVDWDGPVIAVRGEYRMFEMGGESRDTVPLFRFEAGGSVDTLGTWPGLEKAFVSVPNGSAQLEIGFGRDLQTGAGRQRLVLGSTDSLALSVYDGGGTLRMKIYGDDPPIRVTGPEADAWRAEHSARAEDHPQIARAYGEVRVHSTYPAFDGLAVDPHGRIWIGRHPQGAKSQLWSVVGNEGVERSVVVPASGTILAVDGRRMAMLRRSELGEKYVVVYDTGSRKR